MIEITQGNLLDADTEALVNTVNTVGVMGKGIALMFKEAFPDNTKAYETACRNKELAVGKMFVTARTGFIGPKWIINFPTKQHWRNPSRMEWILSGLIDLKKVILDNGVRSVAVPALGAGNGGLVWTEVYSLIEEVLSDLRDVKILVYEPVATYQKVAKRSGVEKLTPARAVIAELVRRYSIIGIECSILEVQKLGYFVERFAPEDLKATLAFEFAANRYGPYSDKLKHLLNGLDGSYLHCDRRLADAGPFEAIRFDDAKRDRVAAYLTAPEAKPYLSILEQTTELIDGFESPLGMELLATVDWVLTNTQTQPTTQSVLAALQKWPGGQGAAVRKLKLFEKRIVDIAVGALWEAGLIQRGSVAHPAPRGRGAPPR